MVVADNASNMKKVLREGNFEAQGCFVHTLQLVVYFHNVLLLILLQYVVVLLAISNILP